MNYYKIPIIMYHYVRDLKSSRYPDLKALDLKYFEKQLAFMQKHFNLVTTNDLIDGNISEKSAMLIFDDGYKDIYNNVFPLLKKSNIRATFAPVVDAVKKNIVLDVNKIQFILAATPNKSVLVNDINQYIISHKEQYALNDPNMYFNTIQESRFDPKEVVYIKRMLQHILPLSLRKTLTDLLFKKYVTQDEKDFASRLYANEDELKTMFNEGMCLSMHGVTHSWLEKMSRDAQKLEITGSLEFLEELGVNPKYMTMTYPFGSYSESTLSLLKEYNIQFAFTTKVGYYHTGICSKLEIPRLDTIDIPPVSNNYKNIQ